MVDPSVIGDWIRLQQLGSGGFGIVTLWQNSSTNDLVAIKKCKFSQPNFTDKQRVRWIKEIEFLKSIKHNNIIRFKQLPNDFETELNKNIKNDLPVLPMEFCAGGNLRQQLILAKNSNGLPESQIRSILHDISSAVHFMHDKRVTHRDLKPENIVLHVTPYKTIYKLIDLGYAKEIDSTVSFVGTFRYLAPEIFASQKYDFSVDYWSMGILTYEMITGEFPFFPSYNAYEMFENIKKKSPKDICIYQNESDNLLFSTTIKHNNHLTNCFKELLEKWLQIVLQYDPSSRKQSGLNVFLKMQEILLKTIVTIFSFYTMEYYSYEVDNCTPISTVKEWIARDLRLSNKDLLMLNSNGCDESDDVFVKNVIKTDVEISFYVFKKNETIRIPEEFYLSNSVKAILKKEDVNERRVFIQAIFFIEKEYKLISAIKNSSRVYNEHCTKLFSKLAHQINRILSSLSNLLMQVEFFDKYFKNYYSRIHKKFIQEIIADINSLKLLVIRYKRLQKRISLLQNLYKTALVVFEENDLSYLYKQAVKIFERNPKGCNQEILSLVSNAIKMKINILYTDDKFYKFFIKAQQAFKEIIKMSNWATEIQHNIEVDLKTFTYNLRCIFNDFNNNKNGYRVNIKAEGDVEKLLYENIYLRSQFEQLIIDSLEQYKRFKQTMQLFEKSQVT